MNKKTFYEAPQAELIVVRFEENFLDSVVGGAKNVEKATEDDPWGEF